MRKTISIAVAVLLAVSTSSCGLGVWQSSSNKVAQLPTPISSSDDFDHVVMTAGSAMQEIESLRSRVEISSALFNGEIELDIISKPALKFRGDILLDVSDDALSDQFNFPSESTELGAEQESTSAGSSVTREIAGSEEFVVVNDGSGWKTDEGLSQRVKGQVNAVSNFNPEETLRAAEEKAVSSGAKATKSVKDSVDAVLIDLSYEISEGAMSLVFHNEMTVDKSTGVVTSIIEELKAYDGGKENSFLSSRSVTEYSNFNAVKDFSLPSVSERYGLNIDSSAIKNVDPLERPLSSSDEVSNILDRSGVAASGLDSVHIRKHYKSDSYTVHAEVDLMVHERKFRGTFEDEITEEAYRRATEEERIMPAGPRTLSYEFASSGEGTIFNDGSGWGRDSVTRAPEDPLLVQLKSPRSLLATLEGEAKFRQLDLETSVEDVGERLVVSFVGNDSFSDKSINAAMVFDKTTGILMSYRSVIHSDIDDLGVTEFSTYYETVFEYSDFNAVKEFSEPTPVA